VIDRHALPTRKKTPDGLIIKPGSHFNYQAGWDATSPQKAAQVIKNG
jgi:hypothetical protein